MAVLGATSPKKGVKNRNAKSSCKAIECHALHEKIREYAIRIESLKREREKQKCQDNESTGGSIDLATAPTYNFRHLINSLCPIFNYMNYDSAMIFIYINNYLLSFLDYACNFIYMLDVLSVFNLSMLIVVMLIKKTRSSYVYRVS